MRKNAYLNNQDILNWYKTPEEMQFTEKGFPILEPCSLSFNEINTLGFNYAMNFNGDKEDYFIHFFMQDYMFTRIWNSPQKYIDVLKQYAGIIVPDFSLYYDMPEPLQRFNHYRNLWFARMCQIQGIKVISSVNWSDENSYSFCFEGLPKNDVFMLSTLGSTRKKDTVDNFWNGAKYCIDILIFSAPHVNYLTIPFLCSIIIRIPSEMV